ncbi:hypothetical protein GQ600_20090 [Phytophthora cactorum]|nr:hypothetical protein GQ600_20090 [Phytophthora cactorum]
MNGAASNNHLKVFQWLRQNRNEGCTLAAMDGAATNGHLAMVQWMHSNRRDECSAQAMDGAATIKVENPAVSVGSDSVQDLPQVPEDTFIRRLISALRVNSELEVKDAAELRARIRTEVTASIQAELSSKIRAEEEARLLPNAWKQNSVTKFVSKFKPISSQNAFGNSSRAAGEGATFAAVKRKIQRMLKVNNDIVTFSDWWT